MGVAATAGAGPSHKNTNREVDALQAFGTGGSLPPLSQRLRVRAEDLLMAGEQRRRGVPCLLVPFYSVWRVLGFTLRLTGRFLGTVLGLVLMIVGILVCLTVVGAFVGGPLAVLGFLLVVRGLF